MLVTRISPLAGPPLIRAQSTLHVWDNGHDGYSYEFTRTEIVLPDDDDIITINLKKLKLNNGFNAHIVSYLCTDPKKVQLDDLAPKPEGHDGPYRPNHPYDPGSEVINIQFKLDEHELVFLGIVVRIVDPTGKVPPYDLICDPQVGNGPPPKAPTG